MKNERGSVAMNVMLVLMLVVIGVLVYLLRGGVNNDTGRNIGIGTSDRASAPVADSMPNPTAPFTDGLGIANRTTEYPLDEFGAGIAATDVFIRDINDDGLPDRITRTRVENGTDHYYDDYVIELRDNDGYVDITPAEFRTVQGAECALQKIQFVFKPNFQVIKISRPWRDSWTTPTMATKTVYELVDGTLNEVQVTPMQYVCDVEELF